MAKKVATSAPVRSLRDSPGPLDLKGQLQVLNSGTEVACADWRHAQIYASPNSTARTWELRGVFMSALNVVHPEFLQEIQNTLSLPIERWATAKGTQERSPVALIRQCLDDRPSQYPEPVCALAAHLRQANLLDVDWARDWVLDRIAQNLIERSVGSHVSTGWYSAKGQPGFPAQEPFEEWPHPELLSGWPRPFPRRGRSKRSKGGKTIWKAEREPLHPWYPTNESLADFVDRVAKHIAYGQQRARLAGLVPVELGVLPRAWVWSADETRRKYAKWTVWRRVDGWTPYKIAAQERPEPPQAGPDVRARHEAERKSFERIVQRESTRFARTIGLAAQSRTRVGPNLSR